MLQTIDLNIGYEQKIIQCNLNVKASNGILVCLLGTNGCGKSTLLRTLAGLQMPLKGRIEVDGKNINTISNEQRAQLLSVVLTDRIEIDNATIFDIVSLGRYPYTSFMGELTADDRQIVSDCIRQVGLDGRETELFNALSDGERQRVTIAKALAQSTDIILLDEPTAHLDIPNRIKIMLLLRRLAHERKKTVICSSHDLNIALQTADTIWLMLTDKGGITEGTPKQLLEQKIIQQVFSDRTYSLVDQDNGVQIKFNE